MANYLNLLFPKIIEEVKSPINGLIKVQQFFKRPRIIAGNLLQSGGLVEEIWQKAIKKINNQSLVINHCLILGFGGGSAATLINQSFPKAEIVGVEIDKEMIQLGKKYFGLEKIKNLKIIQDDAIKVVKTSPRRVNALLGGEDTKFNLVLVDLYLGDQIPEKSESKIFLRNLKRLISPKGIIIFNRLFYKKHKQKTEKFIKKLDKFFSRIELLRAFSNLLVFASR